MQSLLILTAYLTLSSCTQGPAVRAEAVEAAAHGGAVVAQRANPPGRSGNLPPGIERNLARGKPLPPGIAKRAVPRHVLAELPPARDGFEYVLVAGKVILIETATQIVRDILTDVILD